jgi:acyl-CoA thioester hydrolase
MGHMNVMWYVGKFDEATWQLLSLVGLSRSRLAQENCGMAAVEQHIEYKRELRAGDLLTIRSRVLEVKEKSVRFQHEMTNDETGELAATTTLVGVCIDLTARKARPLPQDVRERAGKMTEVSR